MAPGGGAVIVGAARTPIGSFCGALASASATALGGLALEGTVRRAQIEPSTVEEVIMGNVCNAGVGQAPARAAAMAAGLPESAACTAVNKVCASGLKAVTLAAQSVALGHARCVAAGGMESMTNVPHYLRSHRTLLRPPRRSGSVNLDDGLLLDGLSCAVADPDNGPVPMGQLVERWNQSAGGGRVRIDRDAQDAFAIESYDRALTYREWFADEIADGLAEDWLFTDGFFDKGKHSVAKVQGMKPCFDFSERGTVTAGTSSKVGARSRTSEPCIAIASPVPAPSLPSSPPSSPYGQHLTCEVSFHPPSILPIPSSLRGMQISDGAAAVLVMDAVEAAARPDVTPLAEIVSYADAELAPIDFATSPEAAIRIALGRAQMAVSDVDYFEINEAFALVPLVNMESLGVQHDRVNAFGGAVALGHPIGCSGARILVTLLNVLEKRDASVGCAAICNGGGGATAMVIRRL